MQTDTPRTDELLNELYKLKSNTLEYPCEQRLKELCRDLERELTEAHAAHGKTLMMCERTINNLRAKLKLNTRRRDA